MITILALVCILVLGLWMLRLGGILVANAVFGLIAIAKGSKGLK